MVTPLAHCSGTGCLKTEAGERRSAKSARALAVERSLQGEALWCVFLCDLKTSHLCPLSEVHPHVFCFLWVRSLNWQFWLCCPCRWSLKGHCRPLLLQDSIIPVATGEPSSGTAPPTVGCHLQTTASAELLNGPGGPVTTALLRALPTVLILASLLKNKTVKERPPYRRVWSTLKICHEFLSSK